MEYSHCLASIARCYIIRFQIFGLGLCLLLPEAALAQGGSGQPARYQAQYTKVYSEDFEGTHPGIQSLNSSCPPAGGCSTFTSDPLQVIGGKASLRLKHWGSVRTDPAIIRLESNTTYIVELQYRVLDPGTDLYRFLQVYFLPAGSSDMQQQVLMPYLRPNAPASGTFAAGSQLAGASSYSLYLQAGALVDIVIDNISVYRQEAIRAATQPPVWAKLASMPYPRLGKYALGTAYTQASTPPVGVPPFRPPQRDHRMACMSSNVSPARCQCPRSLFRQPSWLRAVARRCRFV